MKTTDSPWFIYLIRTKLNTLYCGITNNIDRRFLAHQQGKGAKYLKGKGPLQLVWSYKVENKSLALKYECRIKKLTKTSKEALVSDQRALPSIND